MNKHLKRLIQVIGGMMMMTLLTGCNLKMSEEDAVKAELAPLYQVLDQQSLEGYDVLSVTDRIDIYGTGEIVGYQVDFSKNEEGQMLGKAYDLSVSEDQGYDARYEEGKIIVETDIQRLKDLKLFFDEFHFSKQYFTSLRETKVFDHIETYMKVVRYEEIKPSLYTKGIANKLKLVAPKPAIIDVEKGMYKENSYAYIFTYTLKDKSGVWIERTFTFVTEEKE